ncbi:DMT family transporter [Bosea sp. (in: a-proteobacteria)]|uniref:DMT family transporter n=1 Tax=Bosea sp. (in: a-proteobacteria) TaxID=1871050 RepID=UPI0025C5074B|nr:DMT family transporter [Bosea sp. (in: a-proteobacteria)]MBR3189604.1 DMT family transporter [Bosea sp. (in: a-proteobacteria)]
MSEDRLSEAPGRGSEAIGLAEALPVATDEDGSPPEPPESHPPERPLPLVLATPSHEGWLAARRNRSRLWWRRASPNLRGTVYMITALLVYAVMVGAFKHLGTAIPLVETLMIRQIIMSAVVCIIAGRSLPLAFKTDRPGLQIFRGLITLASMLCGFSALIHIPLAQATAISFSQVLFVTVAAVLILKERVDAARWIATILGFLGVLIMLNPSAEGLNIWALMSVGGALFGAGITVSVRILGTSERTETILIYQGLVLMIVLAWPAFAFWVWPTPEQWFWLVLLSLFGTAGQWLITKAYQVGEAAALAPLDFSRLILAGFTGFIFFSEVPTATTLIGAAIVIGATLYTMRRNARGRPGSDLSSPP